jgi:NAD(P)-dependent dehydrogenase (short-subunit alcohol dehydrogenase family)
LARHFLQSQFRAVPVPSTSYAGRTVIVTGANGGLGLEAARHFVRLGVARVILACRSTERGETAKADIEQSAGSSSSVIEVWPLDLCSFDSVRAFCRRAEKDLDRLDVLLANAALLGMDAGKMAEGYEMQVTANVISNFLMVFMLLPLMRRTATKWNVETAVTVVASEAHFFVSTTLLFAPFRPKHCQLTFS